MEPQPAQDTHPQDEPWLPMFQRVEMLTGILAVLTFLGCLSTTPKLFWKTVLITGLFASFNFRLLVWSWTGYLKWKQQSISWLGMMLRFAAKLVFFFVGLIWFLTFRPLPAMAVLVGFSPLLVGMVCSPLLLKSE